MVSVARSLKIPGEIVDLLSSTLQVPKWLKREGERRGARIIATEERRSKYPEGKRATTRTRGWGNTFHIDTLSCSSYPLAISCRISPSRLIELLVYTYTTHNDSSERKRDRLSLVVSRSVSRCFLIQPFISSMGIVCLFFTRQTKKPNDSPPSLSFATSYFASIQNCPFLFEQNRRASQFDGFKCNNLAEPCSGSSIVTYNGRSLQFIVMYVKFCRIYRRILSTIRRSSVSFDRRQCPFTLHVSCVVA